MGLGILATTMLENIDLLCDKGREKDKAHEMMSNSLFGESGMEISVQLSIQTRLNTIYALYLIMNTNVWGFNISWAFT